MILEISSEGDRFDKEKGVNKLKNVHMSLFKIR
jgi:hypothetical protein